MTTYRVTSRTRVHTALCAMHGVARHFYDGFYVGLKAEVLFSSAAPARRRK